jgi:hypothetical protein
VYVVYQRLVESCRLLPPVIVWIFLSSFQTHDSLGVGDDDDRGRDYLVGRLYFDAGGLLH